MKLILNKFDPTLMLAFGINRSLGAFVTFGIGEPFPIEQILCHADKQQHQGHNDQCDGAHGEHYECQSAKASFARPVRVCNGLIAERLNALAHRFECRHHGGKCTPRHSNTRKCMDGAQ